MQGTKIALDIETLTADITPTVTPQGTGGATTWGYAVVARTTRGNRTAVSEGTTAVGNATLDGTNFNRITWSDPTGEPLADIEAFEIYRTTANGTPSTTGKIGEVGQGVETFDDTGLAVTGPVYAGANTTGEGVPVSSLQYTNRSVQIAGTFVATYQLQGTIDGVVWNNLGSAVTDTAGVVHVTVGEVWDRLRLKNTAYTSGIGTAEIAMNVG